MICAIYIILYNCTPRMYLQQTQSKNIYRICVSSTQWMLHFERRWPRQHWSWAMPDFWRTVTMENPTKLRHLRVDLLWLLNYMKWLILPWDSGKKVAKCSRCHFHCPCWIQLHLHIKSIGGNPPVHPPVRTESISRMPSRSMSEVSRCRFPLDHWFGCVCWNGGYHRKKHGVF